MNESKRKEVLKWQRLLPSMLLALFAALYVELFREARIYYLNQAYAGILAGDYSQCNFGMMAGVFIGTAAVLLLLFSATKFWHFIDRHRYIIAFLLLVFCVLFQISGSSIGLWSNYLGNMPTSVSDLVANGTIWGIPRSVRSDEWALFTPYNISQYYNHYQQVSEIIRGTATDVTTTYGLASWSVATIFRPFLWGYLILGSARGLSFFWCGRIIFLFLASYEFGKLITNRNKCVSASFAILVTFSPMVQWWFSINGLVEMLIFGQYGAVIIYRFLGTTSRKVKLLCSIALIECAGGFIFTYYPAWEVPLAYIFGIVYVWLIISNASDGRRRSRIKEDLGFLLLFVTGLAILSVLVIANSADTFQQIMSTVYPGHRVSTGHDVSMDSLFGWIQDLFTPVDEKRVVTDGSNASEMALFISFFPLGTILAFFHMFREKKKDCLSIALLLLETLFLYYELCGVSTSFARATLLSYTTGSRLVQVMGYLELILLMRGITVLCVENREERHGRIAGIVGSVLYAVLCVAIMTNLNGSTAHLAYYILAGILTGLFILGMTNVSSISGRRLMLLTCMITVGLSGLCVNPVQIRTAPLTDTEISKNIQSIVSEDPDALWMVTDVGYPFNNLPVTAGARTCNSTNIYPNMELWSRLDRGEKDEEVYNRYVNVIVHLNENENDADYSLVQADVADLNVSLEDLRSAGVTYLLSLTDYSDTEFADELECIADDNGVKIYRIR